MDKRLMAGVFSMVFLLTGTAMAKDPKTQHHSDCKPIVQAIKSGKSKETVAKEMHVSPTRVEQCVSRDKM